MELPILEPLLSFIRSHHAFAAVIVGLLVLGESVAFLSLVVPGTAVLLAAGALAGAGVIPLWELIGFAIFGCLLGDAVSFYAGRRLGPHTHKVWPFRKHPQLLDQGERFFREVGPWGVLIGRFFGPLRAVVPLSAGALGLGFPVFAVMSLLSAPVFVAILVVPGALVGMGVGVGSASDLMKLVPLALPLAITLIGGAYIAHRYRLSHGIRREADLDR